MQVKHQENYLNSRVNLLLELLIMIIFPWPFIDRLLVINYQDPYGYENLDYKSEEFVTNYSYFFMSLRTMFAIRCMLSFTSYMSPSSYKQCLDNEIYPDFSFVLKCVWQDYPIFTLMFFVVYLIINFACLVFLFENGLWSISSNE